AARVTLRNRTERAMDVQAEARLETAGGGGQTLEPRAVRLEPGAAGVVEWPVVAPEAADVAGEDRVNWVFQATEAETGQGAPASDRLAVTQRLVPAVPVR